MKILKATVNKLPESCLACGFELDSLCKATGIILNNQSLKNIPQMCPLAMPRTCGNCAHYIKSMLKCMRPIDDIHRFDGGCEPIWQKDDYCSRWQPIQSPKQRTILTQKADKQE